MPYTKTTWANGTSPAISDVNLNKIEQGIYDALRQDGTTAMSGQLVTTAGTVSAPAIAPIGDTNTGIFFPATDKIGVTINGTERIHIAANGNVSLNSSADAVKALTVGTGGDLGIFYGQSLCFINNTTTAYTADKAIYNYYDGTSDHLQIQPSGAGSGHISFHTGTTAAATRTETMRLLPNGNVGFGSVTPNTYAGYTNIGINGTSGGNIDFHANGTQSCGIAGDAGSLYLATTGSIPIIFGTVGTQRARFDANGYLLIGYTTSNGAYRLQVNSQIFATSATIATSDGRYKENVIPLDGALDAINALNPVQFDWKEHPVHDFDRNQPTIGFIAQEVEQVLADKPYLGSIVKNNECTYDKDGEQVTEEFKGIAEGNLIALLTKAVQELSAKVDALEAKLAN